MVAPTPRTYREAVLGARGKLGRVQESTLRKLTRDVERFADELEARLARLGTPGQLAEARRTVRGMYAALGDTLARISADGRDASYDEVLAVWEEAQARLARARGVELATLGGVPLPRTAIAGAYDAFGASSTWRTLLKGHARASALEADTILRRGVLAGVRPGTIARSLRAYVDGSQPFDGFFRQVGGEWKIDLRELEAAGVKGAAGRMVHNSRRIAFTEAQNARVEAEVQHFVRDPLTAAVLWELSPDRGSLVPPDECDVLATEDFFGLGPGVFPVDNVPGSPHPWDRCERVPIPPARPGQDKPLPDRQRSGDDARIPGTVSKGRGRAIRSNVERVLRNTEAVDLRAAISNAGGGGTLGRAATLASVARRRPPRAAAAKAADVVDDVTDALPPPIDPEGFGVPFRSDAALANVEAPFPATAAEATADNLRALGWKLDERVDRFGDPDLRWTHPDTGYKLDRFGAEVRGGLADDVIFADSRRALKAQFGGREKFRRIEELRELADPPRFRNSQEAVSWIEANIGRGAPGFADELARLPVKSTQAIADDLADLARQHPHIADEFNGFANFASGKIPSSDAWAMSMTKQIGLNPKRYGDLDDFGAVEIANTRRDLTGTYGKQNVAGPGTPPGERNSWLASREVTSLPPAERGVRAAKQTLRHELGHISDFTFGTSSGSFLPIAEAHSHRTRWLTPKGMREAMLRSRWSEPGWKAKYAHEVSVYGTANQAETVAEAFAAARYGDAVSKGNEFVRGWSRLLELFDPARTASGVLPSWKDLTDEQRSGVLDRLSEIFRELGIDSKHQALMRKEINSWY